MMKLRLIVKILFVMAAAAITAPVMQSVADTHQIYLGSIPFDCNKSHTSREEILASMAHTIDSLARTKELCGVVVTGSASPDGPVAANITLARKRAKNIADWLADNTKADAGQIDIASSVRPWDETLRLAREAGVLDNGFTEQDLTDLPRRLILWLDANVFPEQRATHVTVTAIDNTRTEYTIYEEQTETVTPAEEPYVATPSIIQDTITETEETVTMTDISDSVVDSWTRQMRIKSNLPAWLCLWTNVHAEVDISRHLTFTLPIYYSGFNYFTRTLKFRTFGMQPELRYFPKVDNTGFFVGAHFGFFYYNIALDGDYRYQDHNGTTPALGGGIAAGYRWHIGRKDSHWEMEASIGGGIYSLDYDIFHNGTNGLLTGRRKRTFYGIDQASLAIIYRFGIGTRKHKKKGDAP